MVNSVFVNTQGLYQRRRAYNMSYRNDFTCNLGEMVPVYWQDLMPNSSWSCRTHGLIRFMPLLAPIMDNIDFYIHFWIAPRRVLEGEEFTKMITGEIEAEDWPGVFFTPKGVYDYLKTNGSANIAAYIVGNGGIFDMLGYDLSLFYDEAYSEFVPSEGKLNARKFILYFRLLSNWYTNENIEPYEDFRQEIEIYDNLDYVTSENEGNISTSIASILLHFYEEYGTAGFAPHLWPKDYYTSALPTLQYGLPTYLPLGDKAPVNINPAVHNIDGDGTLFVSQNNGLVGAPSSDLPLFIRNGKLVQARYDEDTQQWISQNVTNLSGTDSSISIDPQDIQFLDDDDQPVVPMVADLTEATAITINELRVANALQVFKEREMRFGRRAPEYYKGFYGVTPGDLRLQLPKFLGGGRIPVNISDIEQTSASVSGSPQGKLVGKGTAIAAGFARAHAFTPEEALILGIGWLMPKITYANTLSRHDTKLNDRFVYYNPSFAHIGEQEVYNYEVYAGAYGTEEGTQEFGYQPRYTEYRFHANEMHGNFKGDLAYWTLGRIFTEQPRLNRQFVYMQPKAMQRIFTARFDSNGFMIRNVLASLKFSVAVLQPLSRYGTPGLLA